MDITPGMPGLRSKQATPTVYEDLRVSLVLGRGIVVDTAPEHTKASVDLITQAQFGIRHIPGGRLRFGEQVEYEITGYDPADCTLTLRLAHDWRPGQKDAPAVPAPFPPYIAIKAYRTDDGRNAWVFRCWGDGDCDGVLHLDLDNEPYAEHKARGHIAAAHSTTPPEPTP